MGKRKQGNKIFDSYFTKSIFIKHFFIQCLMFQTKAKTWKRAFSKETFSIIPLWSLQPWWLVSFLCFVFVESKIASLYFLPGCRLLTLSHRFLYQSENSVGKIIRRCLIRSDIRSDDAAMPNQRLTHDLVITSSVLTSKRQQYTAFDQLFRKTLLINNNTKDSNMSRRIVICLIGNKLLL